MSDQRGKLRPVTIEERLAVADAHTEHLNEELSQLKKNYNWTAEEALRLQTQLNSAHVQLNEQAELIQHLKENLKSAFHAGKLEGQYTLDLVLIELGQLRIENTQLAKLIEEAKGYFEQIKRHAIEEEDEHLCARALAELESNE